MSVCNNCKTTLPENHRYVRCDPCRLKHNERCRMLRKAKQGPRVNKVVGRKPKELVFDDVTITDLRLPVTYNPSVQCEINTEKVVEKGKFIISLQYIPFEEDTSN